MSSDDLVAALDSILLRYVNLPFGQAEGIECRDAILIALAAKPEPGLDVERLAEAMAEHMVDFVAQPESFDSTAAIARNIAALYAATAPQEPE